jgi:hypothetical protein
MTGMNWETLTPDERLVAKQAVLNLIGRRLKANAARWRVRRVNRMAGLCSLLDSRQWATYWGSL